MPNESEKPSLLHDVVAKRSTVDIMILVFTITVALAILLCGGTIALVEVMNPATDTTAITESLMTIITGIVGALLGLIAGRGERHEPPP